ncbi:MAG: ROK family protein [Gammaproteobacteria bacterium]|jgi:fructokinase|nr:ROK family protein [Gammaproteobacteria bacterium]MBT3722550.1 ROK family protein [Gammaproteobacteria bacterium]MBT4076722.1 ROK family protein [Gammaproteobacteria bacterium]MBT4196256.1 ROK family protein [Gammaproteobacteria bacterium]MBT4449505.1 ROK family protein [Gammaproteobacteria bacterium]
MSSKNQFKLGIDLGGTKIEAVLLDLTGQIVFKQRVATPADQYRDILWSIQDLLAQAEKYAGYELKVGIGTPGAISPRSGLLRNSNTVCMNGQNLLQDLETTLQRPVRIQNDANCFALSEAMDGAAANYKMVFGVIIGTGTGAGLVFNKQLITGPHAIAGEWGHNFLPWTQDYDVSRDCYCGKQNCIETFLSGPGMAANAKALTNNSLSSRQIVEKAQQGDESCAEQLDHYYDQMARGLAMIINIIDPDAIVLGGGMSNINGIYEAVPARLGKYVFSDFVETKLLPPRFGDSSGVRGAAWLWS